MARHPSLSAGQLVQRELHRRSTYCCCETPPLLDWCGTHVRVGLYRFVSTPFAADFGPGLERASEGSAAGRGVCSLRLSPPTLGLARRRWGAQLDGDIQVSFNFSRRRLRAWPGGGDGGARSWTGNSLSTPLATDFGPGPDGAAGRRAAGRGVCFSMLLAENFGPTLDGAVEGCFALAWSLGIRN